MKLKGNEAAELDQLEKQLYEISYYEFFKKAFSVLHQGESLQDNWHVKVLCIKLQRRAELFFKGIPAKNLIINIPPRSLKSLIVSVVYPAWVFIHRPETKFISSSHSDSLSTGHNMMTRRLLESDWYQYNWGDKVKMAPDQNAKSLFELTKGGGRRATSVGGSIIGQGADIIIPDDIIDPKQSNSEAKRETANNHFDQELFTRLNDPNLGFFIVVMQRLHADDLTGHLLDKNPDDWEQYCIPGEESEDIKPQNLKKFYMEGLFFKERFSRELLNRYKKNLGSYGYSGQIMQRPTPQGGGIWKKWFIEVPDIDFPTPAQLQRYGTDWDTAFTKNEKNSASAYVTSGKMGNNMYIDKIGFVHYEYPDLIKLMQSLPPPHYIENKANGISAMQTLRGKNIPAIEVTKTTDKIAAANTATPFAESGQVYIRKSLVDALYNDPAQGILNFPNGANDDLADVLAQAISRSFKRKEIWAV